MDNLTFYGYYKLNCFEITFDSDKLATRYYEKPFKLPIGVKAEIIPSIDFDDNTILHTVALETNVVPACTPCILESDEVKTYQFWFDETNTDKAPQPNYLHGVTKRTRVYDIFPEEKYDICVLATVNGVTKFYRLNPKKGMVNANRVFLPIPK